MKNTAAFADFDTADETEENLVPLGDYAGGNNKSERTMAALRGVSNKKALQKNSGGEAIDFDKIIRALRSGNEQDMREAAALLAGRKNLSAGNLNQLLRLLAMQGIEGSFEQNWLDLIPDGLYSLEGKRQAEWLVRTIHMLLMTQSYMQQRNQQPSPALAQAFRRLESAEQRILSTFQSADHSTVQRGIQSIVNEASTRQAIATVANSVRQDPAMMDWMAYQKIGIQIAAPWLNNLSNAALNFQQAAEDLQRTGKLNTAARQVAMPEAIAQTQQLQRAIEQLAPGQNPAALTQAVSVLQNQIAGTQSALQAILTSPQLPLSPSFERALAQLQESVTHQTQVAGNRAVALETPQAAQNSNLQNIINISDRGGRAETASPIFQNPTALRTQDTAFSLQPNPVERAQNTNNFIAESNRDIRIAPQPAKIAETRLETTPINSPPIRQEFAARNDNAPVAEPRYFSRGGEPIQIAMPRETVVSSAPFRSENPDTANIVKPDPVRVTPAESTIQRSPREDERPIHVLAMPPQRPAESQPIIVTPSPFAGPRDSLPPTEPVKPWRAEPAPAPTPIRSFEPKDNLLQPIPGDKPRTPESLSYTPPIFISPSIKPPSVVPEPVRVEQKPPEPANPIVQAPPRTSEIPLPDFTSTVVTVSTNPAYKPAKQEEGPAKAVPKDPAVRGVCAVHGVIDCGCGNTARTILGMNLTTISGVSNIKISAVDLNNRPRLDPIAGRPARCADCAGGNCGTCSIGAQVHAKDNKQRAA